ncbi:MAG: nucleotidyltransferase family protein [Limnochordales bacterium]|nr:nucleotidyltransferase family protein [Limnochordales bacterium]
MGVRVQLDLNAIARFCQKHGIRELALFGSVLREDFGDDSDVDVLVQFEADARKGLVEYCRILEELESLLGRKVDLVTPNALSPYLKDRILASREVIYVRRP